MRTLFYQSNHIKVYQDGDKFEIYAVAARNLDGWHDVSVRLIDTYTNVYHRDSFGRTETWPRYNRTNDPEYSYKMTIQAIERREKR